MKSGKYLVLAVLVWVCIAPALGFSQGMVESALFACADLVGLTYRVFIPTEQFVCFEFISADTVIETYETAGSFSVMYFIKGEKPGVCLILTQIPLPSVGLEARITSDRLRGAGAIPRGFPLPFIGRRVETGTCQPGNPMPGSQ
jgi:hypothetical protein